jgi:hypothetical protein
LLYMLLKSKLLLWSSLWYQLSLLHELAHCQTAAYSVTGHLLPFAPHATPLPHWPICCGPIAAAHWLPCCSPRPICCPTAPQAHPTAAHLPHSRLATHCPTTAHLLPHCPTGPVTAPLQPRHCPAALPWATHCPAVAHLLPCCVAHLLAHLLPHLLPRCGPLAALLWPTCCPAVAHLLPCCGPLAAPMSFCCRSHLTGCS